MALNSNFVMNRMGLASCEASGQSAQASGALDATYTASRLGLTFVKQDQPITERTDMPTPTATVLHESNALDARLGISAESESTPTAIKVSKPFWPRFRRAAAVLAIALKKGIMGRLRPRPDATANSEADPGFLSHPVERPALKAGDIERTTVYRKGTYKLPSELMARLKTCAAATHMYQYRLVIESLEEFLTAKGFAQVLEVDDIPEG
ncbi:MAG: hypothetical protein QGG42_07775 [Phycisphaerae bacterium]|jgi:hypothetical protein|nr:hypothetical protein [Phycisphaerae bacterium]